MTHLPASRRRSVLVPAVLVAFVCAVGACSGPGTSWADIDASPGADSYSGSVGELLDTRLSSRVEEGGLTIIDRRTEYLPPGVDWAAPCFSR